MPYNAPNEPSLEFRNGWDTPQNWSRPNYLSSMEELKWYNIHKIIVISPEDEIIYMKMGVFLRTALSSTAH